MYEAVAIDVGFVGLSSKLFGIPSSVIARSVTEDTEPIEQADLVSHAQPVFDHQAHRVIIADEELRDDNSELVFQQAEVDHEHADRWCEVIDASSQVIRGLLIILFNHVSIFHAMATHTPSDIE